MFKPGDKAVFSKFGVGVIKRIETKVISNTNKDFYVFQVINNGLTALLPVENNEGLRPLINESQVIEIINVLHERNIKPSNKSWNVRYREHIEKINTGNLMLIAEVLRDVHLLAKNRDISFGERKVFDTAKELLIGELSIVTGKTQAKIDKEITNAIA